MKIYQEEKENEKSWSIQLKGKCEGDSIVLAVDSTTGEEICELIRFSSSGSVYSVTGAGQSLNARGYNPKEHKNEFNARGQIIFLQM